MKKPIIGVVPLVDREKESYWMLPGYMEGISQAGGLPIMLPLTSNTDELKQLLEICNGFLFTGGQDVSPELYGEEKLPECGECSRERDSMEKVLFELALNSNKSILGICRGIQFINSVLGGTLYQDIPSQKPSELEHHQTPPYDVPIHEVNILTETPLFNLLKTDKLYVNSYHHQGIKDLSAELKVMAAASDDLIEAVYMPEKNFVWAVQWHPEFSFKSDENSRKIFEAFVAASIN